MRPSNKLLTFTVLVAGCFLSMNCSNRQSSTPVQAETNSTPTSDPASSPSAEKATTPESVSRLEARVAEFEKRLAAVEAQLAKFTATTSGAPPAQPESNRKLSQVNAEKAIRAFASTHSVRIFEDCSFNVQSIASIERLSQFSDTEATSVVRMKCESYILPFKFVFRKDIDNQWFLTKIGQVEGHTYNNGTYDRMLAPHQNLKVPVQ